MFPFCGMFFFSFLVIRTSWVGTLEMVVGLDWGEDPWVGCNVIFRLANHMIAFSKGYVSIGCFKERTYGVS